ncbi:hypothetical protein [Longitalea arenae]|uniref:hypothetical protein n=1 Tax=Longitalea arenae TaxID=2812558 RepID=UPI0019673FD4|nr:hypothetical protein [Longitalea arenae]
MSRQIQRKSAPGVIRPQAANNEDPYLAKVIKLVPADVIAVYLGVFTLIKNQAPKPGDDAPMQWIVLALVLIIMPFYLKRAAGIKDGKQIMVSMVSFLIWVLSLGGPLYYLPQGLYSPQFIGAILVPIYTLVVPLVTYPPSGDPVPSNPVPPTPPVPTSPQNT